MLARCVKSVLTDAEGEEALEVAVRRLSLDVGLKAKSLGDREKRAVEAQRERDERSESSARCALEALDAMLRRAAEDEGATRAVWIRLMTAARSAARKDDERLWRRVSLLARWLLGRGIAESRRGHPLAQIIRTGELLEDDAKRKDDTKKDDDDDDASRQRIKWTRLAAAEMLRRACQVRLRSSGEDAFEDFDSIGPEALASCGAVRVGAVDALIELVGERATNSGPTRSATIAAKAIHEILYALSCGAVWKDLATHEEERRRRQRVEEERRRRRRLQKEPQVLPERSGSVERDADTDADSDDDDDARSKRSKRRISFLCRDGLWRGKLSLVVALDAERKWHSSSSHRGPFVAAIDDFRVEVGAEAMNAKTGEYDAAGSAAAAARAESAVAKAWTGRDELLTLASIADRDANEGQAAECRQRAAAALDAGVSRLAWLLRGTPPQELHRDDWEARLSAGKSKVKAAAATTALETMAAELSAVLGDPRLKKDDGGGDQNGGDPHDDDDDASSDSDDDAEEAGRARGALRARIETEAIGADVKRLTARRLCLLLGQLKRKRLDAILATKPEVQKSLHESATTLLKLAKSSKKKSKGSRAAIDLAHKATASMAAFAIRRIFESVLLGDDDDNKDDNKERASGFAMPLLAMLDGDDDDGASAAVGELVAPVALRSDGRGVFRDILHRVESGSVSALGVLESILTLAAAKTPLGAEARRRVRQETAEFLLGILRAGAGTDIFLERAADLGRYLDVDFVASLAVASLGALAVVATEAEENLTKPQNAALEAEKRLTKAQNAALSRSRTFVEAFLGACVSESPDAALALETLAAALRDVAPAKNKQTLLSTSSSPAAAAAQEQQQQQEQDNDDEISPAAFIVRVLDRAPAWISKISSKGGDRWSDCARAVARRVSTSARDAITLRLWGGVADALSARSDDAHARVCAIAQIIRALKRLPACSAQDALLFERLAPVLALKRIPATLWTDLFDGDAPAVVLDKDDDDYEPFLQSASRDDDDLSSLSEGESVLVYGPDVVACVAAACRRIAYDRNDHKAVATLAAECLGRLPPRIGAMDAAPALDAFLAARATTKNDPGEHKMASPFVADRARVAVYALCHAASVHDLKAVRDTKALGAVFRVLATPGADDTLVGVQRGCVHALAMLAGSEAVALFRRAPPEGAPPGPNNDDPGDPQDDDDDDDERRGPLIIDITDGVDPSSAKGKQKTSLLHVAPLLAQVATNPSDAALRRHVAAIVDRPEDDDEVTSTAAAIASVLAAEDATDESSETGFGALRVGCGNAVATTLLQLPDDDAALSALADAVGAPAMHAAAAVLVAKKADGSLLRRRTRRVAAAAWLHVLFVVIVRIKKFPRNVSAVDIFGIALRAARHEASSNVDADVDLRRCGLKIITALLGAVQGAFDTLPPASIMQATSALRSIADLEPNRELRQLAAEVVAEMDRLEKNT